MESSDLDIDQKVSRLRVLESQREQLDAEINRLRSEINASVIERDRKLKSELPPIPAITPPPYIKKQSAPQPIDSERTLGVKWMAWAGVSIAVLGLIICIKIMLDRNLIGDVGRVVIGYLGAAVMVCCSFFKFAKERPVLKNMLVYGGACLAYGVTQAAYSYFELFSSMPTLILMWTITLAMLAYSCCKNNGLLFNTALFVFALSPFFAGYGFHDDLGRTTFWIIFILTFNVLLFAIYKIKKWSSTLWTAFFVTIVICMLKALLGAELSPTVDVLYLAACCAVFYAGAVVLYGVKEKSSQFSIFNYFNVFHFAFLIALELKNGHQIAYSFIFMAVALFVTALLFQKLRPQVTVLFTTPFSFALILVNAALIIGYVSEYSRWFAVVYAMEIVAAAIVYRASQLEYFKRLTNTLIISTFFILFLVLTNLDYIETRVLLNISFLCKMIYAAALALVLFRAEGFQKNAASFVLFGTVLIAVAQEIVLYWVYNNFWDSDIKTRSIIVLVIGWLLVWSAVSASLPRRLEFLSVIKRIGCISLLIGIILFVTVGLVCLSRLDDVWRLMSLAVFAAALWFVAIISHKPMGEPIAQVSGVVLAVAVQIVILTDFCRKVGMFSSDYFSIDFMGFADSMFWVRVAYVALLVYELRRARGTAGKLILSLVLFSVVYLVGAIEIVGSWINGLGYDIRLSIVKNSLMVWLLVLSVIAAMLPERFSFWATFKRIGHVFVLVGCVLFCMVALPCLSDVRTVDLVTPYPVRRYGSIAVLLAAVVFAVKKRNSNLCAHFDVISDIVAALSVIVLVSFEIVNIVETTGLHVDSYGLWLSAWYGLASLILFMIGFKCQLGHLRTMGFVLSAVTVLKIFFHDIWEHELWIKAIVFVAVGVCFILVSYFYSKHLKK